MFEVLCHRRIEAKIKRKIYKTTVRPAMIYGLKTDVLARKFHLRPEAAELRMLMYHVGVTSLDRMENHVASVH